MDRKTWSLWFLAGYMIMMLVIGLTGVIVDPYFHYHKPLDGISYSYKEEEYVNHGIIKNFDYDAMITGTSMTKAFKVSEADELFDKSFVRITNQGEGFKRINENIELAIQSQPQLSMVIRSIDADWFISAPDWQGYDEYPEYLYDTIVWNDVEYLYNKEIMIRDLIPAIVRSIREEPTDNFDNYGIGRWSSNGRESFLQNYQRPEKSDQIPDKQETEEYFQMLKANVDQNMVSVIENNPDVTFYLFIPPYSICWWDTLHQTGEEILKRRLDLEAYVVERLVNYDNVKLFSFNNNFEMICDLNNYVDICHYVDEVNSQILIWMKEEQYLLTSQNYEAYLEEEQDFYCNFDYDMIFKEDSVVSD